MAEAVTYIFDACALIAWLDNEPGADVVDDLIYRAKKGEIVVVMSVVLYYDRIYVKGKEYADTFFNELYHSGIIILEDIPFDVAKETGRMKTTYDISFGDAFAIAVASVSGGTLVTKDHEIEAVEQAENLSVRWIM
jgi:predicted nucleic acid-binding protein